MNRQQRWRIRLIAIAGGAAVVGALITAASLTPPYDGPVSDNFDGKRFANIPASATINKSALEILRWAVTREPGAWSDQADVVYHVPPRRSAELRVTFVNHASVLIQADGLNILTDPIWSERASPVPFAGPQRFRPSGMRFADLPPIDVVLISHNHYDHLDSATIRDLAAAHDPLFLVPLGNRHLLDNTDTLQIEELNWWQEYDVDGVTIYAVPAQHWSRRGLFDTNRALWAGYVINTVHGPVYFAGDTGMGPHFTEISARLGAPRLAILPIGNYLPRWFMAPQHIDPAEAVSAHLLLGAAQSMAIHFGTFRLGDDGQTQPITDLRLALRDAQLPDDIFWVPFNGDYRVFPSDHEPVARLTSR